MVGEGAGASLETYQETSPDAKITFTPQPLFFNVTTDWAVVLQRTVAHQVPVDEGWTSSPPPPTGR